VSSPLNVRRIGIFGSSFDPVHVAHVALAGMALESMPLDQVLFVPTGDPWQKQRTLAPAVHRVAMLQRAIEGEARFAVDDRELRRAGPSYTIDTVLELRAAEAAEWFMLIGQDQYAKLATWHRWRELLPLVTWAVAGRNGEAPAAAPEVAAVPHRVRFVPLPAMAVSSTEIRARLARKERIDGLVPPTVAAYIESNHLYRS
jgi:nicotinate-nucleotide adenylyltransferase